MKTYLKIIFAFLLLSSMNSYVHAGYNYPYVCNNSSCTTTENREIEQYGSYIYMLTDIDIEAVNFQGLINSKLSEYSNDYGDISISINNFAIGSGTGSYVTTRDFTFSGLLNEGSFRIRNGYYYTYYGSGKEYILSNFSDVIKKFHQKSRFPDGSRKSKLSDLHPNIDSYSNGSFMVKRVCRDTACEKTDYISISYNSDKTYTILSGKTSNSNNFPWLSISTNKLSSDTLNAGDSLAFEFGFSDYLDRRKNRIEYYYEIGYQYVGQSDIKTLLSETIYLDRGSNYNNPEAPNNENIEDVLDVSFPPYSFGSKININIKESMRPTETGKISFYFTIRNITTGAVITKQIINSAPVVVIPSNTLGSADVSITANDWSVTKNKSGYRVNDTLPIKINLRDQYGNPHYDYINGYDINLTSGSSDAIELSKGGGVYSKVLTGIKSNTVSPYNIEFWMRMTETGYHNLRGFNVAAKEKNTETTYRPGAQYKTITGLIPSNLYDNGQLMSIFIQENTKSDFVLKCTNKTITINSVCRSDNFSGCNNAKDQIIKYTTEKDNSIKPRSVSIIDYAYNQRSYVFTMNHIDQTPPVLTLKKGEQILDGSAYEFKAAGDFYFEINEKTTNLCTDDMKINYTININGVDVQPGVFDKDNMERITSDSESALYERYLGKVDLTKFLSKAGVHDMVITLEDSYGNIVEKKAKITIYPTDEGLFDQNEWLGSQDGSNNKKTFYTFRVDGVDKYANMVDNYLYTIENLSDKYGNPIYNKQLIDVEHDSTSVSGLKGIFLNESNKSGGSALDIYDKNNSSSAEGNFTFNLRSYTPGEFSQYFKVQLKGWDDSYNETDEIVTFYPNISGSPDNKFLKPISIESIKGSTIETSSGAVCSGDTVWTTELKSTPLQAELKYRIFLNNEGNLQSVTDGSLNINSNSIKDVTEGHKWVGDQLKEKEIVRTFGSDISTCVGFKGQVTATDNILAGADIRNDNLEISYTLQGNGDSAKNITYILNETQLEGCDIPTLGIKVEGNLQGDGKSQLTGQESNFSDISLSEMRGTIRRNAFQLITNMNGTQVLNGVKGQILNGIRYVEGDVTIGGVISGYETLIVRNGNILINQDLSVPNTTTKPLGIILLKDNYNVNVDYGVNTSSSTANQGKGNVFVTNNVRKIDAVIYADGTFRSARDSLGSVYSDSELSQRLVLNGTLFTRNTIGGATELVMEELGNNGEYLLPGGRKIPDYELSAYYDLNFVRKVAFCEGDPESYAFLIRYDARVQTNPPKGFTSN